MDMTKWKPNQKCPYGITLGDRLDGGTYLLLRLQLISWKMKLLGISK